MTNISLKKVLGGDAISATLYALSFTLYTLAFSLSLNIALIRVSYGVFYALSFWYFGKVLLERRPSPFIKILNIMLLIFVIYGTIVLIQGTSGWRGNIDRLTFLRTHVFSILPIYPFYYFGEHCKIRQEWFSLFFVVFLVDAYLLYYNNRLHIIEELINADEGFTNNTGYVWASLLPMVAFINKKKWVQYLSIGIIMFFVLTCFKRGAIASSIVTLLFFVLFTMRKSKISSKIALIIFGIGLLVVLINYFDSLVANNDFFSQRYEVTKEGDSSGRDYIFSSTLEYFFKGNNVFTFLFGNGAFGTVKILGIEAHNDWLEYAIDLGLLGIILYFIYWIRLSKNYRFFSKRNADNPVLIAMGMVIIFNFTRSFFSMSLYDMSFFSAAILGYTMSVVDLEKKRHFLPQSIQPNKI